MSTTTARIKWLEGTLSLGLAGKHGVVIDRSINLGGTETGFKASELLLLSLGGCLSSTLVGVAKARNLTLTKVDIQVIGKNASNPDRFGELEIEADLTATNAEGLDLGEEELDKLLELAERGCFVTNTLRPALPISFKRIRATALSH